MTTETSTSKPGAGEIMLAVIAFAIIVVVGAEAAFVAHAAWVLLPGMMAGVLISAGIVIYAVMATLAEDSSSASATASAETSTGSWALGNAVSGSALTR